MRTIISIALLCIAIAAEADARILVKTNTGYAVAALDRDLSAHGGKRVGHLPKIDVHVVEARSPAEKSALLKALKSNRHIKFAEIDERVSPNLLVNDPFFPSQWHLTASHAIQAWDSRTGVGVTIAILDSGIHAGHPDLAPKLVAGWNTYDNNSNTADVSGHGTKTAGTAAAAGNNAIGIAGVAFGSLIMPIRITDLQGFALFSTAANGIIWAADHGARVASISYAPLYGSSTVLSAAQYMRSKGGVVVVSSGNTGAIDSTPDTTLITVVSATDQVHAVTGFSTFGPAVDIAAPGVSILTTDGASGYGTTAGTSFSTPIVAGVYALMIAGNPNIEPSQLDAILCSTASDIGVAGKDQRAGCGLVFASNAVLSAISAPAVDGTPPTVSITSPASGSTVKGIVVVSVTASDNVGVIRTELHIGGKLYATDASAPYAYSLDTTGYPDGNLQLSAKAFDSAGNVGTTSVTLKVQNAASKPKGKSGN